MDLVCWRCGQTFTGIHGKDTTCQYCLGDIKRIETLRLEIQNQKKGKEPKVDKYQNIGSIIYMIFGLLGF